jgi:hypothetical protein
LLYAEEEVRAGIAWLDERADDEWRLEINTEVLDMRNSDLCILGQLFGSYDEAIEKFGLIRRGPYLSGLGFYRCDGFWYEIPAHELQGLPEDDASDWGRRYALLTETWKTLLEPVPA